MTRKHYPSAETPAASPRACEAVVNRRGFLRAMVLFIAAVLAGWRPKPALAALPKPAEPPLRPLAPDWMRIRRARDNAEMNVRIGDRATIEAFSRGGDVHVCAVRPQSFGGIELGGRTIVQPIASKQPRLVFYDQSGHGTELLRAT